MSLDKECSMTIPSPSSIIRFFGVDLHKHFLYIAAVNSLQEIIFKPLKITLEKWPDWTPDHLLPSAAGLTPQVWVPPPHIREARCLLAHRRRLVGIQTMTRNRLHSLLHRHMLELPPGSPFSDKNLPWWDSIPLSPTH